MPRLRSKYRSPAGLERAQAERVGGSGELEIVRDEVEARDLKAGRAGEVNRVERAEVRGLETCRAIEDRRRHVHQDEGFQHFFGVLQHFARGATARRTDDFGRTHSRRQHSIFSKERMFECRRLRLGDDELHDRRGVEIRVAGH